MQRELRWLMLVLFIVGTLVVPSSTPVSASSEPHADPSGESLLAGGDTRPPTNLEAPDPVVPAGGDSRWFAIVLYVLFVAAGVGLVVALVRRPSRTT